MKKERETRFDILRITSMFLVIVIHVANCYCRNIHTISNSSYLIAAFFNIISRVSVPIFFMISGALLGKSRFDLKKYLKRLLRFFIVIVLWDFIYLVWEYYYLGVSHGPLITLLHDPFRKHLWFLYTIFFVYMAQPIISIILNKVKNKGHIIITIIWIIISLLFYYKFRSSYILKQVFYIGYFIMGNILYEHTKDRSWKKYNIPLSIIFIISIGLNLYLTYSKSIAKGINYKGFMSYSFPLMILAALSIFILVMNNYDRPNNKFILKLANVSFGIYLIHGIFLDIIKQNFNFYVIPSIIGVPLLAVIIFAISFVATSILKKIPILNKYTT